MAKTLVGPSAHPNILRRPWPAARVYLIGAILLFTILLAPFLSTIFLAIIFAFFLHPFVTAIKRRTGFSKSRFLTVTFTLIMTGLVAVSVFGVSSLFDITKANRELLMSINSIEFRMPAKLEKEIASRFPEQAEQIGKVAADSFKSVKDFLIGATGTVFSSVPFFMMSVLVFFLALHFFLANSSAIYLRLRQMQLMEADQLRFLLRSCREASRETFISVLVIGVIQSLIVTLSSAAIGLEHVIMIFFATFFLALIPVIGAAPVAFVIGIYMFFQGGTAKGVIMVAVGLVTGTIDNVLRSWLMSKGNHMPAGISFVCLIGAIIVFGFYGIFFGPFLGFLAAKFLTRRASYA
jgi:predicted PurR-regulated permease PerM